LKISKNILKVDLSLCMNMAVKYSKLSYTEPAVIRLHDQNVELITWALRNTTIDRNWFVLRILRCSDAELQALTTGLPAISSLIQDFQSGRNIFFHIAQCRRFTEEQVSAINALLTAKHTNIEPMLRSYYPTAPQENSLYPLFCHWASLGYLSFKFFMMTTAAAVEICKCFHAMKSSVDGLLPLLNGLVLGTSTTADYQSAGREAVATQQIAYESIKRYFNVTHPPHDQGDMVQNFLWCYIADYNICTDLSVAKIKI
jgi:hypothetical protein